MFNSDLRKRAESELREAVDKQKEIAQTLNDRMEALYRTREKLKEQLTRGFEYINSKKNTPENIKLVVEKLKINLNDYQELLDVAQAEYKAASIKAGGAAAGGIAAGVGVAALAPTAALAVATTFGTAATGTAIASLSGAAATNAALAWLGGGALAAGGAGIAGGEALLALAGPIGWAIGGTALVGSGLMMNGKNKKAASEMFDQAKEIVAAGDVQKAMKVEINQMISVTFDDMVDIKNRLTSINSYPDDFNEMSSEQITLLGTFVNNAHAAAKHLNMVMGEDRKFVEVPERKKYKVSSSATYDDGYQGSTRAKHRKNYQSVTQAKSVNLKRSRNY
ncbi:hypothetical protein [Latilactobacillus sakei]|uniref:hypothetical protein n=1 Tax=Latilactobacillus sakei TaxID=1599 RepID=UPI003F539268